MLIKLVITFSLILIKSLSASIDINHPLTIGELIDIALENQPSTKQAWWNANRAASALGNARAQYYPKLDFNAFATHGREFKFLNGPNTNFTIVGADILLSMMLYDFGETCASVKAAKMALLAANWQVDGNIQKVMVNVLENAYALIHAQEVVRAAIFALADAERMLNSAIELNRSGLNPVVDVYFAKATYAQMKMDLAEQKSLYDIQRGKLAAGLGFSSDTFFELASLDGLQLPAIQQQAGDLIALAYQQRADLMVKRAELSELIANKARARSSYFPKLSLSGRGGANHAFHDKANGLQYEVTLGFRMPLFNGFETMYQNRIAFADTQISREDLLQIELDISLEVLTNSRLLEAAQEMLPDAEENLKNSHKAYESILEIYQAGKERITAVSDVQRQLAAARIRYSDIKTRWLVSIAKLAYSTGTLQPYMERQCEKNP